MTTTSPQPDGDRAARIEELAAQTLAAVRRLESALVGSAPGSAPVFVAAKTAATVALVAAFTGLPASAVAGTADDEAAGQ